MGRFVPSWPKICFYLFVVALCAASGWQGDVEPTQQPTVLPPLNSPDSVPSWARPGAYRSARWDGGPIEAEKGRLSGWPGYADGDSTGILAATRDWYNPKTVEFLKIAGINWAWVTWSVGFSRQTEGKQWEQLRRYISECHKNGIRVAAYVSIANMFWSEMFENAPQSKAWVDILPNGSPRYYSFPHRYMARIDHPGWLEYARARVRAASDAGADSFWIDNTFGYHDSEKVRLFLSAVYGEAAAAGRKVVVMSNYNRGIYTWARYQNGVTTEDAQEPGFYPKEPAEKRLVTNAGLLRYLRGISEGWRPVSVEYGGRHYGERFTTPMEPEKWQFSLAECASFQASLEPFFEGVFLRDLYRGDPKALEKLKAMGRYNAFFERHKQHYEWQRSAAPIAVLSDTTDRAVPLLNQLAARNVQFDVLFNYQDLPARRLSEYRVILLPHTNPMSNGLCSALLDFVKLGGTLAAIQDASLFGDGEPRADFCLAEPLGVSVRRLPQSKTVTQFDRGLGIYYPLAPSAARLADELKHLARQDESVRIEIDGPVLYNVVRSNDSARRVIHLLNYSQNLMTNIPVCVGGQAASLRILSPDAGGEKTAPTTFKNGETCFQVPDLLTYSLVTFDLK